MTKEDSDLHVILKQRQQLMVTTLSRWSQERGEVLFERQWLKPEQARRNFWRMRVRGWVMILEFGCLFFGMAISAWLIFRLMSVFAGLN